MSNTNYIRASFELALFVAAMVFAWLYFYHTDTRQTNVAQVAEPAKATTAMPVVPVVAPKIIYVYPKAAKAKLELPAAVQGDTTKSVVAASKVRTSLHDQTVTTVIDQQSGKFTTYTKQEPYPWLAPEQRGDATLSYGFRGSKPMARLTVREDLVQLKAMHLGVIGSVDQDGQHYVGVGISYRW